MFENFESNVYESVVHVKIMLSNTLFLTFRLAIDRNSLKTATQGKLFP